MSAIASAPGSLRLFVLSIVARLPLTMLSIGLLVHAQGLTGSFAAAGLVTGAYAIALGVGGPLLGRAVDRCGQTRVLVCGAVVGAAGLGLMASVPAGAPLAVLVALAIVIGLASPPVGACLRTLLPGLLPDPAQVHAAYAIDAAAVELTWISGPPLALAIAALLSTGATLVVGGAVMLVATTAFAATPASRGWRPDATVERGGGGSLQAPAMRTLVVVMLAVGAVFGAVELGVAGAASESGHESGAGPLLGVWGLGSLVGGLVTARAGGGAKTASGLALILVALTVGHLALAAATSLVMLGIALFVAGTTIAPTFATIYAMVERVAPAGTVTEAFAWVATAAAIGSALGAAVAGPIADGAGPATVFALAAAAGVVAVLAAAYPPLFLSQRVNPARSASASVSNHTPAFVRE